MAASRLNNMEAHAECIKVIRMWEGSINRSRQYLESNLEAARAIPEGQRGRDVAIETAKHLISSFKSAADAWRGDGKA